MTDENRASIMSNCITNDIIDNISKLVDDNGAAQPLLIESLINRLSKVDTLRSNVGLIKRDSSL